MLVEAILLLSCLGIASVTYRQFERKRLGCSPRGRGYIYFWRDGLAIKIGRTNNLQKRLKTFQTAHVNHIRLLGSIRVRNDRKTEAILHRMFCHARGEFYWITPKLLIYILLIKD